MLPIAKLLRQGLVLLALFFVLAPLVRAQGVLHLQDTQGAVDVWPFISMRAAGDGPEDAARVRREAFQTPQTPHGNLGRRQGAVWLKLPLVADGDGRWVLQVDFAALDHVEGWLFQGDRLVAQAETGDHVPAERRPVDALTHALALQLQPGVPHELLLRVESTSPLVLPMRLARPQVFERDQDNRLLLQGVLAGLGLGLAVYAFTQWLETRDPTFAWYAVATASGTLYFVAYYGIGARHLWGYAHWWVDHGVVMLTLVGVGASSMLADRLMEMPSGAPRLSRIVRGCAALAGLLAVALLARLLPLAAGQAAGALLILVPAVISVAAAWPRWRAGDRAAPYLMLGWAALAVGLVPMVLLLRGVIGAEGWTQELSQMGRVVAMLTWLRVIGVRLGEIRHRAERAEREHRQLHVLAHADALTGLPNRRGLDGALQSALQRARDRHRVAVFVGDLDGFKAVNDRLGHEAGDDLLVAAARRLRSRLRHGDVVARLGGDEFVVVAENLAGEDEARQLGQQLVEAFGEPFLLRGDSVRVGLTIGLAITPDDGQSPADLLRRADEAMYAGKRAGKSRLVQCRPLAAVH